jgi:hypothetical protein
VKFGEKEGKENDRPAVISYTTRCEGKEYKNVH